MVAWAAEEKYGKAGFLCICVDRKTPVETAKWFREQFFTGAPDSLVNGYIEIKDDFPNFAPQLGCQGFIVFDSKREIVEGSSLPWLAHRDSAFRRLERQLGKLLGTGALPSDNPMGAPIGQLVKIKGVSDADESLNGQQGEVDGSEDSGTYHVVVGGERKRVRPDNLEDATGAPVGKTMRLAGVGDLWAKYNGHDGEVLGGTASGRLIVEVCGVQICINAKNLQEIPDEEILGHFNKVVSVGHEGMDAQHQECIGAFKKLCSELTSESLQVVRQVLKEHFDEEESLLKESGFGGGDDGPFSALTSHSKDHDRIIRIADDALAKLSSERDVAVPKELVGKLCKAFVEHATMYDSLYEGKLQVLA
jgi:hemerythrin